MPPLDDDDPDKLPTIQLDWEPGDEEEDIETANEEERRREIREKIRDRFPFLNVKQIELVATLDEAIDNATPKVRLPRLRIENFEHPWAWKEFFFLLIKPLVVFVVAVSVAIAFVLSGNPTVRTFYPYVVTVVTFAASSPAIKGKYEHYYEMTSSGIEAVKKRVEPAIDNLEVRATRLVVLARGQLDQFLASIKVELQQVTKAKNALRSVNSSVEIPDVSDLEGYLDDSESQIHSSILTAKSALELDQYVPWVIRAKRHFYVGVLLPVLVVMLGIQLFGTWQTEKLLEPTENKWDPVIVSSQTFVIAVAEIAFSFFLTRAKRVVRFVNRNIKSINRSVNRLLKNKACDAFHSVLDISMTHVRERVLEIVKHVRQIERLAVGVRSKAHDLEHSTVKAADTVLFVENTIQDVTNFETHTTSSWMQKLTMLLHTVVEKIDHCTAGLIDCTGFVETPDESQETETD